MKPHLEKSFRSALRRFSKAEDGALTWFAVVLFMLIIVSGGMAVDFMFAEYKRTRLQGTLDRAVLAAADLDQTGTPQQVVQNYLDAAGMPNAPVTVDVEDQLPFGRRVLAVSDTGTINTLIIRMLGFPTLPVRGGALAEDRLKDAEIVLVLDNSGSMGWDSAQVSGTSKLSLLQDALDDFVVDVLDSSQRDISVSVVPFAEQVTAGAEILSYFRRDGEHDFSHCVDWQAGDFSVASINDYLVINTFGTDLHQAMPLFNRYNETNDWVFRDDPSMSDASYTCRTTPAREILLYQQDVGVLQNYFANLEAAGLTSIELGVKWGLAVLDPSFRPVVDGMVGSGSVPTESLGRPDVYGSTTEKYIIVMSDGENTYQMAARSAYRSDQTNGFTDVYGRLRVENDTNPESEDILYSSFYDRSGTDADYFFHGPHDNLPWDGSVGNRYWEDSDGTRYYLDEWYERPVGYPPLTQSDDPDPSTGEIMWAGQLSWPEIWNQMSIYTYFRQIEDEIGDRTGDPRLARDRMYDGIERINNPPNVGYDGIKNDRLSAICDAARDAGVTRIYGINFEGGVGAATALQDCASPGYFYTAGGDDLSSVFSEIAANITSLRLSR